jgi:proteasome lid subunit RPN8/RPN11
LIVLEEAWGALCAEVARAWPAEACGLLVGPSADKHLVSRTVSLANVHPHKRRAFAFDEREHAGVLQDLERRGEEARAFFHSHPEGAAALSPADEAGLVFTGEPLFPGVGVVVLATRGPLILEAALFTFAAPEGGYLRGDLRRG